MRIKFFFLLLCLLGAVSLPLAQADAPLEGRAGRAEVRFLEGMIDHHQMALDMAAHCLEKAESQDLLDLCQAIIAAQKPEIEQMQAWLLAWYNIDYAPMSMEVGEDNPHAAHGAPHSDPPMMMGMMAGFNRLKGVEYELAWLESMIDHHDDALHMSERLLTRAQHAELRALAEAIISAQSAEIERMEAMIAERAG